LGGITKPQAISEKIIIEVKKGQAQNEWVEVANVTPLIDLYL